MREGDVWFFDRVAPLYHRVMPAAKPSVLAAGLEHADRDLSRIIDLGGGTGRAASAIEGHPIIVDASRGMLSRVGADLVPVQASATKLPLPSNSIDAVLIVDAFHHLPDQRVVLGEVARVLRDGGVVVIRDFDPTTIRGRAVAGAERLIGMRSRFLSPADLADHLQAADLTPITVETGFTYTVVGRKS